MAVRLRSSLRVLACLPGWLISCGSDADEPSGAPAPPSQGGPAASELPYMPCAPEAKVGEFVIELASDFTRVGGKVFDGTAPSDVLVEVASEGDCRLLTPPTLLCDPGCPTSTQMCGANNTCVPLPRARDLGRVAAHGLVVPLEMTPNPNTRSYANPALPRLPHPGFVAGADLRITTAGGEYEPFELRGWGISLLEPSPEPIRVESGAPTRVSWQAPADPGPARLHVSLSINNHGSRQAWVECDFADTGAADIPATLIDGLIAEGVSGFPTITLTRRTAGSVAIEPGCVELLVASELSTDVDVDGIQSCNAPSDCPAGQTCLPLERYCQ